jgi:hypothetical protein
MSAQRMNRWKEYLMRNLLLAGTAGLFLALGAATAYAVPPNSPYATMVPPGAVDGATQDDGAVYADQGYGYYDGNPSGAIEGRAAFVDSDYGYDQGYVDPGYGYNYPAPVGGFYFGGGRGHFGGGHFGHGHFGGGGHWHAR